MASDILKDKNALVTGCYGFVASWIIAQLLDRGVRVVGLTEDVEPESALVLNGLADKICIVRGSITDPLLMERVFTQYEIQFCFHLAAQTVERTCTASPLVTFETNTRGTWNVLEAARRSKFTESVVVASSDKAYGEQEIPYRETQPLLGRAPYDVAKACADLIAQAYFHTFQLPVAVLRCANIYGGGDFHWSRIVPGTIRSVFEGERPVIRSDGSPLRDYMYAADAANAYITLAEAVCEKPEVRGEGFNFGMEKPISALDLVKTIIGLSDKPDLEPEVLGKGRMEAEIDRQYLCCDKARNLLDWQGGYVIEAGLRETIAWYNNYLRQSRAERAAPSGSG